MSELAPSVNSNSPVFATSDTVPFRLTPNLQRFLGNISLEGIFNASIIAIARCLTVPQVRT
jgi:transformation/transcription domain-associated protein